MVNGVFVSSVRRLRVSLFFQCSRGRSALVSRFGLTPDAIARAGAVDTSTLARTSVKTHMSHLALALESVLPRVLTERKRILCRNRAEAALRMLDVASENVADNTTQYTERLHEALMSVSVADPEFDIRALKYIASDALMLGMFGHDWAEDDDQYEEDTATSTPPQQSTVQLEPSGESTSTTSADSRDASMGYDTFLNMIKEGDSTYMARTIPHALASVIGAPHMLRFLCYVILTICGRSLNADLVMVLIVGCLDRSSVCVLPKGRIWKPHLGLQSGRKELCKVGMCVRDDQTVTVVPVGLLADILCASVPIIGMDEFCSLLRASLSVEAPETSPYCILIEQIWTVYASRRTMALSRIEKKKKETGATEQEGPTFDMPLADSESVKANDALSEEGGHGSADRYECARCLMHRIHAKGDGFMSYERHVQFEAVYKALQPGRGGKTQDGANGRASRGAPALPPSCHLRQQRGLAVASMWWKTRKEPVHAQPIAEALQEALYQYDRCPMTIDQSLLEDVDKVKEIEEAWQASLCDGGKDHDVADEPLCRIVDAIQKAIASLWEPVVIDFGADSSHVSGADYLRHDTVPMAFGASHDSRGYRKRSQKRGRVAFGKRKRKADGAVSAVFASSSAVTEALKVSKQQTTSVPNWLQRAVTGESFTEASTTCVAHLWMTSLLECVASAISYAVLDSHDPGSDTPNASISAARGITRANLCMSPTILRSGLAGMVSRAVSVAAVSQSETLNSVLAASMAVHASIEEFGPFAYHLTLRERAEICGRLLHYVGIPYRIRMKFLKQIVPYEHVMVLSKRSDSVTGIGGSQAALELSLPGRQGGATPRDRDHLDSEAQATASMMETVADQFGMTEHVGGRGGQGRTLRNEVGGKHESGQERHVRSGDAIVVRSKRLSASGTGSCE